MTLSPERLSGKVLLFSLLLLSFLVVGATIIETIEPSQIGQGEEESITLVDGVVLKVRSPYIFHYVEGVSSFGRVGGLSLWEFTTIEVKLKDLSSKVGNVTVEAELTEVHRRGFKLYVFEPIEFELWSKGKPAIALMEKDCDWRCRVTIDAGSREKLYLTAVDIVDPSYPIVIAMKYNLSYYELLKSEEYEEYGVVIPFFSRSGKGEVEVKGRFESSVPIEFYAYLSRRMGEEKELLYRTEGTSDSFTFRVGLSKDWATTIRFKVVNISVKEAYVKIWAEASWLKSPDFEPISWYIRGAGEVHEVKIELEPRYVEKNSTYKRLVEIPKSYYWHEEWEICPKGYNHTIEIRAEEPSGIPFKLLLLDSYNYKIFRQYDPKVGRSGLEVYEDPSGILPIVTPFYEVGPTSNVTVRLSGLKKCYSPVFIREGSGLLTIKYNLLEKWVEEPRTLLGDPIGWTGRKSITLIPIIYASLSILPPTIVEGGFEAENPVNISIGVPEMYPWRIKGTLYEARNTTTGEFSFYIYGVHEIGIFAENLGWKPTEVRVWVKYNPVKVYLLEETATGVEKTTYTTTPTKPSTETKVSQQTIKETTTEATWKIEKQQDFLMYIILILLIVIISVVALAITMGITRRKVS